MGAWIETKQYSGARAASVVAPFMGAWIETPRWYGKILSYHVAPFMGAWIETRVETELYGSMD